MTSKSTPFSLSEEAFLLNSLREVTKVWASQSGKASFNFSVQDGQAHLQLGFQLGLPGDHHLPPSEVSSPRYKGSVRKQRDRMRAAEHQARLKTPQTTPQSKVAVPATSSVDSTSASNSSQAISTAAPAETVSRTTASVEVPSPSSMAASASPTITVTTSILTPRSTPAITSTAAPASSPCTTTAVPAVASSTTTETSTVTSTSSFSTLPPSTRPVRPFCQPDKSDPLRELPYFIDDLKVKVHYSNDKTLKVKHRSTALAFTNHVKKHPEILYESKNYNETFVNFCEESDRHLYVQMFS